MPRGDRTGPAGMGPMTGRAAGFCAGFGMPGYMNPAFARGFGMGFGRGRGAGGGGRGWRNRFFATGQPGWMRYGWSGGSYANMAVYPNQEIEKQDLKTQAEALRSELDLINKRLSEIEAGSGAE